MRPELLSEELEEYEVVVFEKNETAESFSVSAEIKGETIGCTFPKNDKWLSEYNGSPGYVWKLRKLYEKNYEQDASDEVNLGRY